nr:helix-turn-helix transcriptional regulator [Actinokineospora bangkokensis]
MWDASRRGDRPAVLRAAREHRGWSQADLGARFGCSRSVISRLENGRRDGINDVETLRRLAAVLELPARAFGILDTPTPPTSPAHLGAGNTLGLHSTGPEGVDPVRRRAFLLTAGMVGAAAAAPRALAAPGDTTVRLATSLEDALIRPPTTAQPATAQALTTALACARTDFRSCRYLDLATRLTDLIGIAEATDRHDGTPTTAALLAATYNLVTRVLLKSDASGSEWIAADRAMRAANAAGDPLVLAEAHRMLGSAFRRAGDHDRAQELTLAAADHLDVRTRAPHQGHLALHGLLMCSAGYAAARAGDRHRAVELLDEAHSTTARLTPQTPAHAELAANVLSHRVSAHYLLGDAGTALHHAHTAPAPRFPDTERHARYLADLALCFNQWDKPNQAHKVLAAIDGFAPDEIRTRSTIRRLVGDLLGSSGITAKHELRALAHRAGIPH